MSHRKTRKEQLVELLTVSPLLTPKEVAAKMDISETAARGLVRRAALEGVVVKIGYGQYSLPPEEEPENSVITPQEKPPEIIGKNPHTTSSQNPGTLHGVSDVPSNPQQATHQDSGGSMEVPLSGGLSTVRIPEYVDVIMFGQVVARVKMSTVIPGMVQRVDITDSVFSSNVPLEEKVEPPTSEKSRA